MTPDLRPRCEAQVNRYQYGSNPEEPEYEAEPCGRLAKGTVQVGNRAIPTCNVHRKMLERGR